MFFSHALCSSNNDDKTPSPTNSPTKFDWKTLIDWPSSDDVEFSHPIKRIKSSSVKQKLPEANEDNVEADIEQNKIRKKRFRELYRKRRNDPKKWRHILDEHNKAKLKRNMIKKDEFSKKNKRRTRSDSSREKGKE